MTYFDFAIIGGDQRQHYLHKLLCEHHYSVICYGITPDKAVTANSLNEILQSSKTILAPIPFSKDGITFTHSPEEIPIFIDQFIQVLKETHTLIAGNIPANMHSYCRCIDLMKQEPFITANSIATAEAAAAMAILHFPDCLQESSCLITGYGHCAKALAQCLKRFDAAITIAARSAHARKEAESDGFRAIDLSDLTSELASFSILFNTIPAPVFSNDMLPNEPNSALYLELASPPGGIADLSYAKKKLSLVSCSSLPGRFSPLASAKAIFNCLI